MGVNFKLGVNIQSKYLLVISALIIISSLLFAPFSPLSVVGNEYTLTVETTPGECEVSIVEFDENENEIVLHTMVSTTEGIAVFTLDEGTYLLKVDKDCYTGEIHEIEVNEDMTEYFSLPEGVGIQIQTIPTNAEIEVIGVGTYNSGEYGVIVDGLDCGTYDIIATSGEHSLETQIEVLRSKTYVLEL